MTEPMPPLSGPAPRLLRRSYSDRKIAGVLGGVAAYLNMDSTVVRALYLLLAVFSFGTAVLAYPVLWMIMPEE